MDLLILCWVAFGILGLWIAAQKNRNPAEGLVLGVLFGPLGVIVEATMPSVDPTATRAIPRHLRQIDDINALASIAQQFRAALEAADPNWHRLPYHRQRSIMRDVERQARESVGMSPTKFADYAAEARDAIYRHINRIGEL